MIYLKLFENHSEYVDFTGSTEFVRPNVSHCIEEKDVHYSPNINLVTALTFNHSAITLGDGEDYQLVTTILPVNATNKNITWSSSDDTVATVVNGLVTIVGSVGDSCVISAVTTDGSDITATCTVSITDYAEIDGVKWARKNIGASSVTDGGLFFQWADTQGYTAAQVGVDKTFDWDNYKYWTGDTGSGSSGMTKYSGAGETELEYSDDGVRNVDYDWRMPTKDECSDLGAAVNAVWTTNYKGSGIAGLVCTDKVNDYNVLFFPACGFAENNIIRMPGEAFTIWSSSRGVESANIAFGIDNFEFGGNVGQRFRGYNLRGIYVPT